MRLIFASSQQHQPTPSPCMHASGPNDASSTASRQLEECVCATASVLLRYRPSLQRFYLLLTMTNADAAASVSLPAAAAATPYSVSKSVWPSPPLRRVQSKTTRKMQDFSSNDEISLKFPASHCYQLRIIFFANLVLFPCLFYFNPNLALVEKLPITRFTNKVRGVGASVLHRQTQKKRHHTVLYKYTPPRTISLVMDFTNIRTGNYPPKIFQLWCLTSNGLLAL